jgi:hypothetical protein
LQEKDGDLVEDGAYEGVGKVGQRHGRRVRRDYLIIIGIFKTISRIIALK